MARATNEQAVRDAILKVFPDHVFEKGGQEIYVSCCFCGHDNKKLAINPSKGVFQCWVCEERGPVIKLFNHLRNLDIITQKDITDLSKNKTITSHKLENVCGPKNTKENILWTPSNPCVMPSKTVSLSKVEELSGLGLQIGRGALNYLELRGIPLEFIEEFNIHFNIKLGSPYYGHLLFPVMDHYTKEMVFWTTRTIRKSEPKTYHSGSRYSRFKAKQVLANEHLVIGDTVALCEGPFDAFSIYKVTGLPACPLFGKRLHPYHVERLKELGVKKVYLCLDPDTEKEIYTARNNLLARDFKVKVVVLKEGDPNEVSPSVLYKSFEEASTSWHVSYL